MDPRPDTAIDALFALEAAGIKLGLAQVTALVEALERPDRAFRSVIVAGTNGKGSVTAMVEQGLRAAGCRTGRFTSPHLVHLEERFALDGQAITRETLEVAAARVLRAAERLPAPPSFFEATTALALDVFREGRVDVAVLEVGLGGRLDATNVVDAMAAAITSVDFDHQEYLGRTLGAIAREKAGVIRRGAVVVLAANPAEVNEVVTDMSLAAGARLVRSWEHVASDVHVVDGRARATIRTPHHTYNDLMFSLAGRHQVDNAICAIRLLEELPASETMKMTPAAIRSAIEDVVWPGRLEPRRIAGIDVIIDGAHNPAGARALAAFVGETFDRRLPMVVGTMRDKDVDGIIAALAPAASCFVMTAAGSGRAAPPDDLADAAARVAPDVHTVARRRPLDAVKTAAGFGAPVIVAGSLYLAGEIRLAGA